MAQAKATNVKIASPAIRSARPIGCLPIIFCQYGVSFDPSLVTTTDGPRVSPLGHLQSIGRSVSIRLLFIVPPHSIVFNNFSKKSADVAFDHEPCGSWCRNV